MSDALLFVGIVFLPDLVFSFGVLSLLMCCVPKYLIYLDHNIHPFGPSCTCDRVAAD